MESLGAYLRKEREIRNLSLAEIAVSTRIRERLLKAIEEDRYDLLPHPLYVRGYLGAYARRLGFDPGEIILRYQNHLTDLLPSAGVQELQAQIPRNPIRPWKTRNRSLRVGLLSGTGIGGFLLVVLALYGLFESSGRVMTPSETKSMIIQSKVEAQKAVEAIQKEISMIGETEARDVIPAEPSPFEVLDVNIGKAIELEGGRSILKERCSEFFCNNERAYFFTRIKAQKEGKITHLWYRDGKEFHRVEIDIKPPAWTAYTYLTLRPGLAGDWMAELRDGNTILSSRNFKAVETSGTSIPQ